MLDTSAPTWFEKALCREAGSTYYFDGFYELSKEERQAIVDMCNACPVKLQCFEYAVETKSWGIWAGKEFRSGRPYNALKTAERQIKKMEVNKISL